MQMKLVAALIASALVSLISLIGLLSLLLRDKALKRIQIFFVAFAAGGLIGGAFLHILPEAMRYISDPVRLFLCVIIGFMLFFILEKYFYWRHCHDEKCELHAFTYLNILGDIVHNFTDGLIMGASFLIDIRLGIAATTAIIAHEIPHEFGNFMVLIYGGFSKGKALFFNFISSLAAIAGTLAGYYFARIIPGFSSILLPLAAGGFIYIASCDLIPEVHKEYKFKRSLITMAAFIAGIALMYILKVIE
ncbi:MAG: ZIP family metal transporter [Candidatus Omnitrophota bacterium]